MLDATFRLKDSFVAKYKAIKPPFGYNGLGELVYLRTYSRIKDNGRNEQWYETVRRVVEGTYRMQERHIMSQDLGWNDARAQKSAQEMYDRIFTMKFLPPGRGLWAMGSSLTEERGVFASLNNCSFISLDKIDKEFEKPFCFLMDASMLGVGVGFDTSGAGKLVLQTPEGVEDFVIPDTREGWVASLGKLLRAFFVGEALPMFDYSLVRAAGEPIKCFGGVASGPGPLRDMHESIASTLLRDVGKPISVRNLVDIMNIIGACVVAGNVRRTAELCLGKWDDAEYLDLKNYRWNSDTNEYEGDMAERSGFGWTSNNSVLADIGMNYSECAKRTGRNGEPGYVWMPNMRKYSRMDGIIDNKDSRARGGNPCLEQTLESYELCCLVESFPANHDSLEDYLRTLKFAYLYAKTVTLGKTHWPETNKVMLRNRRIGCSMSGVQQFAAVRGLESLRQWCEKGYDAIEKYDETYSEWFAIPRSIKRTSIKPSGTVSLLAGATPGMHWPEDKYYIRRMRLSVNSDLVQPLVDAGYVVEPCVGQEGSTLVVEVPVALDTPGLRTVSDVSLWEQVSMAAFLQRYWSDNQVSCSVTFKPDLTDKEREELKILTAFADEDLTPVQRRRCATLLKKDAVSEAGEISRALDYFQYQLKGISFLPKTERGAYAQMPYEGITQEVYEKRVSQLKPLVFKNVEAEYADVEKFCDGDKCLLGAH